jgi:hypothetical protein
MAPRCPRFGQTSQVFASCSTSLCIIRSLCQTFRGLSHLQFSPVTVVLRPVQIMSPIGS